MRHEGGQLVPVVPGLSRGTRDRDIPSLQGRVCPPVPVPGCRELGWSWVHFRSARTDKGWRTPVSGPLGQGWPDLILIRGARAIAAELKSQGGRVSEDQLRVLGILAGAGFETHTWRPADWPEIEAALR